MLQAGGNRSPLLTTAHFIFWRFPVKIMTRFAPALIGLTALTLTSTGLACPVKPGTMFKGGVSLSPKLGTVCGAQYREAVTYIKKSFARAGRPLPPNAWIEIYAMRDSDLSWMQDMASGIVQVQKNRGLKQSAQYPMDNGAATVYKNAANGHTLIEYQMYALPLYAKKLESVWVFIGNW